MAVYDFGIDEDQDVKRALADAGFDIGPATVPVNNTAVTSAVQAASANVIAIASAVGVTADAQLLVDSEETHTRLKDMAIAGSLELLALRHGRMSTLAAEWKERFEVARSELVSQPANFGEDVPNIADVPHIIDDIETGSAEEIGGWDWEEDGF